MSLSLLSGRGRVYLIAVCSLLSLAAGAAAGVVPAPWSWALAAAALLTGGVAGLASRVPAFLVGRPVVPPTVAVALASVSAVLVEQAFSGPEGMGRAALLALAVTCAGLAGKPLQLPGAGAARPTLQVVLAMVVLGGLAGCSASQSPGVLGGSAFTFKTEPTIPIEQCLELADKHSRAESVSVGLTALSGGGAVLTSFLVFFLESKAASATSGLVSAGAAGGALYAKQRASGLDELLAIYGCPRPFRQP
jgi:hypothetical protein